MKLNLNKLKKLNKKEILSGGTLSEGILSGGILSGGILSGGGGEGGCLGDFVGRGGGGCLGDFVWGDFVLGGLCLGGFCLWDFGIRSVIVLGDQLKPRQLPTTIQSPIAGLIYTMKYRSSQKGITVSSPMLLMFRII